MCYSPQCLGTLARVGRGVLLRRACGGQQSPRPGHTSLRGRGVLPRWWSGLKEGQRGTALPKARAQKPRGTGSPAMVVVGAQGGPAGGNSP